MPLKSGLPSGVRGAGADELSGDELKRLTFEAVSGLVRRAGEQAPVVMIIEDVHWMDDPSREMLARGRKSIVGS
jgi:predicted ATPase